MKYFLSLLFCLHTGIEVKKSTPNMLHFAGVGTVQQLQVDWKGSLNFRRQWSKRSLIVKWLSFSQKTFLLHKNCLILTNLERLFPDVQNWHFPTKCLFYKKLSTSKSYLILTDKSFLVCVNSEKYAFLVTFRLLWSKWQGKDELSTLHY